MPDANGDIKGIRVPRIPSEAKCPTCGSRNPKLCAGMTNCQHPFHATPKLEHTITGALKSVYADS